jgi:hypothetical protein
MNMKRLLVSTAIAFFALTASGFAKQEIATTRTVYELSDFPDLATKAKAICEGKQSMSDKLKAACAGNAFPKVTKAGAFRNTGIGAELNTLIRQ